MFKDATARDHVQLTGVKAFYCQNRQAEVTMLYCLDSYVNVNALHVRDSQCYKCQQGHRVRVDFSAS